MTSKLSCLDQDSYLAKWYTVNLTGLPQEGQNISQVYLGFQNENVTDKYQKAVFSSLNLRIPTDSEVKTLIKEKKIVTTTTDYEELRRFLQLYLNNIKSSPGQVPLTLQQQELLKILPKFINQKPSKEQQAQLEVFLPYLFKSFLGPNPAPNKAKQLDTLFPQLVKSLLNQKDIPFFSGVYDLVQRLGPTFVKGKLSGADTLLGLGAIYLSYKVGGFISADDLYILGKAVFNGVASILAPKTQPPLQFVGYAIPEDVCATCGGNLTQCDPNLIPVPFKNCNVGNDSKCVEVDPIRGIGYCDDNSDNCIIQGNYTPPLPGSDGIYYYPATLPGVTTTPICNENDTNCNIETPDIPSGGQIDPGVTTTPICNENDTNCNIETPPTQPIIDPGEVPPDQVP